MTRPLSLLDRAQIPAGGGSSDTLIETVRTAQLAEQLGYHRVWFAEHHNTEFLASASPEMLVAYVGARTTSIRLGSGGVMLPNQAPLKVTETFHLLEAMYPDRIDLGLGRAPGTDQKTAFALRRTREALAADDYPQNVMELLAYDDRSFPNGHIFEEVVATPTDQSLPPVWQLGSSPFSGQLAAQLGLGYSFAAHFNKPLAVEAMRAYRAGFQPSYRFAAPQSMLAVEVILGQTDAAAQDNALLNRVSLYRQFKRIVAPAPSLDEARAIMAGMEPQFQHQINSIVSHYFVGTPATVAAQIKDLADRCEADEVMFTTAVLGIPAERDFALHAMKSAWETVDS